MATAAAMALLWCLIFRTGATLAINTPQRSPDNQVQRIACDVARFLHPENVGFSGTGALFDKLFGVFNDY